MSNVISRIAWGAAAAASLHLATPVFAADTKDALERVSASTTVMRQLMAAPDDAIPEHILDRAEAIVVIPSLVKGGFVVGAEHGKGIMSVRDRETGTWSVPSFVAMTGGSFGWQIGLQAVDLVLVVMNKDGLDGLLSSEFTIGGDGSVAVGPVGRTAQAGTDATMQAKILAYSRARGLFAGATVKGSALGDDTEANEAVYGRKYSAREVFTLKPQAELPASINTWRDTLRTLVAATR